jgi:hypothetical protein
MNKALKIAVVLLVMFTTTAAIALSTSNTSYAAEMPISESAASEQPAVKEGKVLSFVPICSDVATATSKWQVTNENKETVSFQWNNVENDRTGSVIAPNGTTDFTTFYNVVDPNNRTEFTDPYHDVVVSRNAQVAPCAPVTPPAPLCIDGTIYGNITYKRLANNLYEVATKDGTPLCEDVTLYLSSYLLPETYNGKGFEDPSATPQTKFATVTKVLSAGTITNIVGPVALPDTCQSYQVDLYYGPEITTVGPQGHGAQLLEGIIYEGNGKCNGNGGVTTPTEPPVVTSPVVTPPLAPVTPTVPVTPEVTEPLGNGSLTMPVELPETGGISSLSSALSALLLGMLTYTSVYLFTNRKQI